MPEIEKRTDNMLHYIVVRQTDSLDLSLVSIKLYLAKTKKKNKDKLQAINGHQGTLSALITKNVYLTKAIYRH